MKRYVSSAVSIENLKTQFAPDMDDAKFKDLIDLDPSADFEKNKGGKYCPWIFRQEKKGNLPVDQYTNLKDALGYFLQNYKKYPKSDLGQYKTVEEFLSDTEAVGNRELTDKEKAKMLKKAAHHASDEDKKFVVEDGEWEVWTPLTYAGSISLARQGGTKASWCTAYEGDDYYYKRYTNRGPLYIFLNTSDPNQKYQLHFESNSWYDINDSSIGMHAFYQFASEHPAIGEYFEIKSKDGIQTRGDSIVGFDETATEFVVPEGITGLPESRFPSGAVKISLPDSLTTLSSNVFANLEYLTDIKLPNSIKSIPDKAFVNCTSLESIEIPDSVKLYGERAFSGCTSLKHIKHSANLVVVRSFCFKDCFNLKEQLPDTVKDIGINIFCDCTLDPIEIPPLITEIDSSSFLDEDTLTTVKLNNVTSIDSRAFSGSSVEKIDLRKVDYIGTSAFRHCNSLQFIELNPDGVVVGPHAFADSKIDATVTIYPTTELSLGVFDNCPNLIVEWKGEDQPYEFENIKKLICSEKNCPKLVGANKTYVTIETTEGDTYEAE